MERHYDVLGVSPDADRAELRRAYRTLSKEHHPDQGGSRERFLRIKTAYEEITGERAPEDGETDGGAVTHGRVNDSTPDPTFDPAAAATPDGPRSPGAVGTGHGLRVDGDLLSLTLSGLVHDLQLASIVDGHVNPDLRRTVAFFEVENSSDRTLRWRGRENTSFIGDDGFMYEGSTVVRPRVHDLPAWWCAHDADVRPGRALRAIVVAQQVPDDVTIEKLVYTQHASADPDHDRESGDTERYLFEIKPRVREALGEVPFDLE